MCRLESISDLRAYHSCFVVYLNTVVSGYSVCIFRKLFIYLIILYLNVTSKMIAAYCYICYVCVSPNKE